MSNLSAGSSVLYVDQLQLSIWALAQLLKERQDCGQPRELHPEVQDASECDSSVLTHCLCVLSATSPIITEHVKRRVLMRKLEVDGTGLRLDTVLGNTKN